jgi:hypothetical protein
MKRPIVPFATPRAIDPDLLHVRTYWEGLKRGANDMPFWDDVKVSSLPDQCDKLMLIDVFVKPQRFRFGFVGQQLIAQYGESIISNFIDETELRYPLEYLASQCCATVESQKSTFYACGLTERGGLRCRDAYSRLLLPMWGNGHIGMLLGAWKWS